MGLIKLKKKSKEKIDENKDENLYANVAGNGLSIVEFLKNIQIYVVFLSILVLLAFLVTVSLSIWFTGSILLSIFVGCVTLYAYTKYVVYLLTKKYERTKNELLKTSKLVKEKLKKS